MKISWKSRKGQARRLNNDAAALAYIDDYLVAVVVDAAEKSQGKRLVFGLNLQGKRLASYWADTCVQTLSAAPEILGTEHGITRLLAGMQKCLRQYYLFDIASYGVLILHRFSGVADWYYTGDCRLGVESVSDGLQWQGSPHRVDHGIRANTNRGASSSALQQAARHTLTRSLNAKRFSQPELIKTRMDKDSQKLLIATDGHWCERHSRTLPSVDDASLLMIAYGPKGLKLDTDTPNIFITYRK